MARTPGLLICGFLALVLVPPAAAQDRGAGSLDADLRAIAAKAPELRVDAAGLTRSGRRIWSVEPILVDPGRPKVVIVGGLDGSKASTGAVIDLLRWWTLDPEAAAIRGHWQMAALPCALPDACDAGSGETASPGTAPRFPPEGAFFDGTTDPTPQHLWRWTTIQAPTLVVELRAGSPRRSDVNELARGLVDHPEVAITGSLVAALGAAGAGSAWSAAVPAVQLTARSSSMSDVVSAVLERAVGAVSPLRVALQARMNRTPLDVARMLALKYPADPIMSYIPALSWSGALRVAELTGDAAYRTRPLAQMAPFLDERTPAVAEPYLLTSLAGHLAFADLGALTGNQRADVLARNAADFMLSESSEEIVRFRRAWTDDMFMATSVLARVAARTKEDRYARPVGRLLTAYVTDLQRPDGLFVHAKSGAHAWGRGNGFAAFGLMDALTYLPSTWADRPRALTAFRSLMQALVAQQAPDGMWRQVVDEPGSYREFTVTAMMVAAMARGVRSGWIDAATYRPVVERAWRGLLARVGEDGSVMDVCTGTGAGPTREYYLNRAGLTGADDRGGAMGLTAALEMAQLSRP
jgi:rhamnogalacturonyl hydrolase YesR